MKHAASPVRFAVLATLLAATAPAALAQQAAQTTAALEEVVVTAQRRAESLQTVPVAVSAFTDAQLESRQITSAIDLARIVPNLLGHNNTGTATANTYFMRGLGSTEQIALLDPAVSTYVDDVIIPRQNANNYALFDVERVEVLRGPQGTTFGRNSTGGAINVITKKPGTESGGFLQVGAGNYNRLVARGSVDMPVSDKVLTKLSAFYAADEGWLNDLTNNAKLNDTSNMGVRGALRWLASDDVTWDLSAEYMVSDGVYLRSILGDGKNTRTAFVTGGVSADTTTDMLNKRGLRNETSALGITSNIEWRLDKMTFNSITGYRSVGQDFVLDFSFPTATTTPAPFALNNEGEYDAFSQEFKLTGDLSGSVSYVAGFYFFYEDNTTLAGTAIAGTATSAMFLLCTPGQNGDGQTFCSPGVRGYSSLRDIRNRTTSYAGYAQFDWKVTDALTVVAGGRYTDEEKEVDLKPTSYGGMITSDLVAAGIPTTLAVNEFTPKFGVDYQFNPDLMAYASWTKGFKAGGWNSRTAYKPQEFQPMDPEKTESWEAGVKSELFDNRLRLNANVFYAKTKGLQLSYTTPGAVPGTTLSTQDNAGDIKVQGLEIEFTGRLGENVDLYGSAGFQSGEYTYVNPAAQSFCRGGTVVNGQCSPPPPASVYINAIDIYDEPSRLPERTFALGASWKIPMGDSGSLRLAADANYNSGYWTTASNARPDLQLVPGGPYVTPTAFNTYADSYTLWNASIGFESASGSWRAVVECKNCSDKSYITSVFNGAFYGEPRRYNGYITYKF